jgi:hypothetical protein
MANYLITGGTGFIGSALATHLVSQQHRVWVLTRQTERVALSSANLTYVTELNQIPNDCDIDGIINLAGEPLNAKRWNTAFKKQLKASRVDTTLALVAWAKQRKPPKVLISGSAIGWYGHQGDNPLTENSPARPCFAHKLCKAWEHAAETAKPEIERVVLLRTGIVLDKDGGPLAEMLLPFKLGMGGKMGSGEQVWSWIHRQDIVGLIDFILNNPSINGPINATAPNPCSQAAFAKILGKVLKRPTFMPMPAAMANLVLGGFAEEILLNGQAVYPAQAQHYGFTFQYPELPGALREILNR